MSDQSLTRTVPLSRPAKTSLGELTELTFREPLVDDLLAAQSMADTAPQQELILFATLTNLTPEDVRRLPLKDYLAIQKVYNGFLS